MSVRTLVLLRHAKSAHPDGVADFDRPLTARGHADAAAAGAWLRKRDLRPALVLCSPARRTRETCHGVQVALGNGAGARVEFEPALYHSGAHEILDLVRETGPDVEALMVIGHNPSMSMLSVLLDPGGRNEYDDGLRTAGLAVHRVDGAWADCGPARAPLSATHTARAG